MNIASVCLEGTPRERGRAQGEGLRPLIVRGMDRWKDGMHEATGLRADDYLARFVESTDYLPAIERWASPLLEEVRGIGEGAGIPFRDIYVYQLMDEEWLFRTDMLNGNGADTQARRLEHCSVIGICGQDGSAPILAQNMDLPKYYDGAQALLRITHQGSTSTLESLESFVFTAAGLIGTLGLNNQGIGLCVNTLTQLSHTYHGLPVAFVTRRLLESRSIEEAVGFVRDIQHASGQNYAISGPDGIVDFECSARKAVQFAPHSSRLCHTNHPLANDDQPARQRPLLAQALGKGSGAEAEAETGVGIGVEAVPATTALSNSEQRYVFLDRIVSGHGQPAPVAPVTAAAAITVEQVKSLLSTCEVPISVARNSKGNSMTLGSVVMELSIPPVMHVAPGPPAETAYTRWTF